MEGECWLSGPWYLEQWFGAGVWVSGSSLSRAGRPPSPARRAPAGAADTAGQMFSLPSALPPPFI